MANLYFYVDKRSPRSDGSMALKIALSHNHKVVYHSTGVYVNLDNWDARQGALIPRAKFRLENALLANTMSRLQILLANATCKQDYKSLSARELMDMIAVEAGYKDLPKKQERGLVLPVYEDYISLCRKPGTANLFRSSLKNLQEYEPDLESLRFEDMNVAWLRKYQNWLEIDRGMTTNGANVYLRNLRTIFNYALKNELTEARYPFRDIDMSTTDPDKKLIPYEKFLEWATKPMPDCRGFYRDLFLLSFYLCGIRPVDLLHAKKSQIEDGRLVYYPEKLNGRTKLSIKIEPEAWEIIHKYEGHDYLIDIMESRSDYKTFLKSWNKGIRAIGEDVIGQKRGRCGQTYATVEHKGIIPYITVYYARTCWASYAFNLLETPMDIISQALGHKSGLKVTNFYVKRDEAKVDEANRRLIERVTKDMARKKKQATA